MVAWLFYYSNAQILNLKCYFKDVFILRGGAVFEGNKLSSYVGRGEVGLSLLFGFDGRLRKKGSELEETFFRTLLVVQNQGKLFRLQGNFVENLQDFLDFQLMLQEHAVLLVLDDQ